MLNLQDKNVILDNIDVDNSNKTISIHIHKKVVKSKCPCCGQFTKRIHDHRFQEIKYTPINRL